MLSAHADHAGNERDQVDDEEDTSGSGASRPHCSGEGASTKSSRTYKDRLSHSIVMCFCLRSQQYYIVQSRVVDSVVTLAMMLRVTMRRYQRVC